MEPQHSSGQSQSVIQPNPYGSYAYTSHDSVHGKGCPEPSLQGKKGHYSAAAYILWIIVGGASFLLAATTGHAFIPCEEGQKVLKEQVPNLNEWYDRAAFVFFTAFVMDLLNIFFERNSTRSELVMLPCFIKGISCANNLLLYRGFGLILLDINGRPLVVQRFLQWMVTTPTMLVLLSLSCKMTPHTLVRTIVMDEMMIVTGIMASIIPGILGYVSAVISYGCFMVVLWDMHFMFSSAMEEAAAQDKRVARMLWISELHSMVIWVGFGVVWTLGHFELISMRWEELGLIICDFLAKVVFSESLMLGSLKAMEVRRLVAMRAIEDTGKQRLIEELREMVQQKERFMSNVSHELRTPLNGIIGLSEGLLGGSCGELAEDVQKQVTIIRTSGARLLAFINDVMDAAALKRGRLKLKREVSNLERIVQDVLALTQPLVKDAVRLQGIIPRHVHVICDPGRLIQVLNNLLGNAAKFTSMGSILVSCEETQDVVAVSVADTGVGIPEQAIPYIFMPFAQVDADTSSTYGGTGLGLSIVQELVTAQGGIIKVKSKVGEGSVFTFTLPRATAQTQAEAHALPPSRGVRIVPPVQPPAFEQLALPEEGAKAGTESWSLPRVGWWSAASDTELVKVGGSSGTAEEERASTPPPTGSEEEPLPAPQSRPSQGLRLPTSHRMVHRDLHDSYQVLSVDDDEVNHAVLESLLCPAGFEVVKALDGTAALDFLKTCSVLPDIILLDIMMPGLSGYEVCKSIREMLPDTPLPIIMVTAKSLEEDVVRGLHAGATDCLAKPFWGKELLARMEAHLRTSQLQREEHRNQSALTVPSTSSSRVTILCIDDDEVSHLVMKGILHNKVYNYESALTGREAIERLKSAAPPPDLVLLDLNLPDVSGFEVITQIRQLYPRKNIPVIMVSGNADEHFVVKGLKSGCNDYITKPFRREEMLARIETNLRIKFQTLSMQIKEDAVSSMELLQRILPDSIIQRLQQGEKLIADLYKDAVVLVASFPSLADVLADCDVPTALVFVNHLVSAFDRLAENHQLCTVDCAGVDYVAVAPGRQMGRSAAAELEAGSASPWGLREEEARAREEGPLPVERVYLCALAMMDVARTVQLPQAMSRAKELGRGAVQVPASTQGLELKLSIHLGPVWAGLVGSRCPKYSFVGTTMQQALELNSFALPGSVLVSEAAAMQLRQAGERLRPLPEKDLMLRFSQPLSLLQVGDYMLAEVRWRGSMRQGPTSELPTAASSVPGMDAESMIEEVEDLKDMLADSQNQLQASQSNLKVATLEKRQLQRALNREQQRLKAAQGVVGQLEDDLRHLTREVQGRGKAAAPTLWPAHAPTIGRRASLGSHATALSGHEQGAVLEEAEEEEEEEVGVAEEGSEPLVQQPASRRIGGASFASTSEGTPSDRATPQGVAAVAPPWPSEPPPSQAQVPSPQLPQAPPLPPPPPPLPAAPVEGPAPLSAAAPRAAVESGSPEVSQLRDEVQQLRQQLESVQRRGEQRPERAKGLRKRFSMFRS